MSVLLAAYFPAGVPSLRIVMLGAGAFLLYGAGRLVMGSIPARVDRPGLRALLGAAMVFVVSMITVMMGRADLGIHLPIACSTAAMTFGVASLILGRRLPSGAIGNRSWALVAPAVAIAFVGGWAGRLDPLLLTSLALYGLIAIASWREEGATAEEAAEGAAADAHPGMRGTLFSSVLWLGGIAIAGLAAVLLMLGVPGLEAAGVRADALAVTFLLAPAIVVPIFFELLPPCRSLGWNGSASVLAKFALLNLCFVLPSAALVEADASLIRGLWASHQAAGAATQPTTVPALTAPTTTSTTTPSIGSTTAPTQPQPATSAAAADAATTLLFPAMPGVALRVDLLILAGAMLLLIPLAAGWQRPGMLEAAALLTCYVLALLLTMVSVWRR